VVERKEQSKFRTFLANAMRWFLMDHWKGRRTIKAGGDEKIGSLDAFLEDGGAVAAANKDEFGHEFDLAFALHLLNLASNRFKHAEQLEAHLRGKISQKQAAEELGMSENSFRQAYMRFRERLAQSWRAEISKVVGPDEKEIRAEMQYLMALLTK
jgi:DNA-directed RNA polymerase specialized sigma24 family protein